MTPPAEVGRFQTKRGPRRRPARIGILFSYRKIPRVARGILGGTGDGSSVPKRCFVIVVHPLIIDPIGPVPIGRPAVFRRALELIFSHADPITA